MHNVGSGGGVIGDFLLYIHRAQASRAAPKEDTAAETVARAFR